MKKITDKKLRKKTIQLMRVGVMAEGVADHFDLTLQEYMERMKSNEQNARAYEVGRTKLMSFYQDRLRSMMYRPNANKDAMKIFYSHFLEVMEQKPPLKVEGSGLGMTHEQALEELENGANYD